MSLYVGGRTYAHYKSVARCQPCGPGFGAVFYRLLLFRQLARTVLFQLQLPVVKADPLFCDPCGGHGVELLTERSLRFAGTACAVLMQVSLVLFFIDRYTVNLIARLDDSRIIYHFLYTLISVFTLLAAGWICARCSKACVDFALFYRRFSLGYLPLCAFLFILQFFLLRTFGNIFVTANSVPFRGEIYCLWYYAKTGTLSFSTALHSAGNVLYFTSLSLALCGTVRRRPVLWGTLVPVALSVFVESFQLLTKSGDADVDDIILNTLGAVLGVLIFRLLLRPLLQKETRIC